MQITDVKIDTKQKAKIVQDLGISSFSIENQDEIIANLEEYVGRKIILEILESMDENDRATLVGMTNQVEVMNFLNSKIPNLKDFIKKISKQSIEDFKEKMKGVLVQ